MMRINDMFVKPINRDMKGVIKVGQADDENIQQELEEYVVTKELQKHFRTFFASYKRGIIGTTDKMGVWVSGFFGSGKSHFLKILSYLLSNKVVNGKEALTYFEEDHKILDSMVLADMRLAASVAPNTDVILFNIDSKSEMAGKQEKDAIVSVFLKVFNEKQGFCGTMPYLADLERNLSEKGRYQEFQDKFEEINGLPWTEARYDFGFIQDDIVDTLEAIGFMSREAALNWCEKAMGEYNISIEGFADMVRKYIERKGNNHHVVFLVDEIGQYIGDDSRLMLNLQTVTEDLGTACKGKAWIIVTSQQDIDSITKTKGNDFSKIQGRFDTRLALSSANVDEVIRKRVLEKTTTAEQTLTLYYDQMETVMKNLLLFNDGIEKKLYSDRGNFAAVYPFVPYQFDLLGDVLTAIRTHGASGKHLAEGERSMLALFKESAASIREESMGTLIPFHKFYDALEKFLDHSHSGVIAKAYNNTYLQPFDVDLLKALFMIKYVKEIRSTIENLTTLMVSNLNSDRLSVSEQVKDALTRLVRQTLVQRNGDGTYTFLTNEEQEINHAIENLSVDPAEITGKISEMIFDDLYDEKKYRYPALNGRYTFAFNQLVDGKPYKANASYDITLKILTPDSDEAGDRAEITLRMISGQSDCVLVVLPDDRAFIDEIRSALKIEKFLRGDALNTVTRYETIKEAKKVEMRTRQALAKDLLKDALASAAIYVGGHPVQTSTKEVKARINEAMGRLVNHVYHKLNYIDTATGENDIRKLLNSVGVRIITMEGVTPNPNSLALADVNTYIGNNTDRHTKTSLKTLMDRFTKAPYGFVEQDVQWLVTKLFMDGEIAFFVNSETVTVHSKTTEEIVKMVTRKEYLDKLMTERKKRPSDKWKKEACEVMRELFHAVANNKDDEDSIMTMFVSRMETLLNDMGVLERDYTYQSAYPGRGVIAKGKRILTALKQYKDSYSFMEAVDKSYDDLMELAEDYEPVKKFFAGDQKTLFDTALKLMQIYDDSSAFFTDEKVDTAAAAIKTILTSATPYNQIYKLPGLIDAFRDSYVEVFDKRSAPIKDTLKNSKEEARVKLAACKCDIHAYEDKVVAERTAYNASIDRQLAKLNDEFYALEQKLERCNNVATLETIPIACDNLRNNWLTVAANMPQPPVPVIPDDHQEDTQQTVVPKPVEKKHRFVTLKAPAVQVQTVGDVDAYLQKLRTRMVAELQDNTIVHIDF